MARFVFKHGDWTSVQLRIRDIDYDEVKQVIRDFAVKKTDPEFSVASFLIDAAMKGVADTDNSEILRDTKLSDYFSLTDNYRTFDAERVAAHASFEDVYLIVLNENEDNIRAMLFRDGEKSRWFTVKR